MAHYGMTPEERSALMSRIRGRDTKPELTIRRALHAIGFRFRLHRRDLPGRPDLVLPRHRAVILVHGCFWHNHGCQLCRMPATNREFWAEKLEANRARDRRVVEALAELHWRVLTVWECSIRRSGDGAVAEVITKCVSWLLSDSPAAEIPVAPLLSRVPRERR